MDKNILPRKTKTSLLVEEIMKKQKGPASLEQLHSRVVKIFPATSYSTTYRIIQRLESRNLIMKVDWKERGGRYEWANRIHHHHLVCEKCNEVKDIGDEILNFNEKRVSENTGYIIKHHSIELVGVCMPCRKFA